MMAPLRIPAALMLLAGCVFPALGLSGTAIEYSFNGSHFSAISPMCAINPGDAPVAVALTASDPCIRAVFADGGIGAVLQPGGEECILLERACGTNATSVKITAASTGGSVSTAVARSAKITPANPPPAGAAPGLPPAEGPPPAADGAGARPSPVMVLIPAIVILSVCAWHLTRHFFCR